MRREEIEKVGILIAERDSYSYGYTGTESTYYNPEDDCIYIVDVNNNQLTYTGKNSTGMAFDRVSELVRKYNAEYFELDEDQYEKLVSVAEEANTWGGYREGAGRPSTGRKKKSFYITDEENEALRGYLETLRRE